MTWFDRRPGHVPPFRGDSPGLHCRPGDLFEESDISIKALGPTPRLTLDWISRYFDHKAYAAGADQNAARHPQSVRFRA